MHVLTKSPGRLEVITVYCNNLLNGSSICANTYVQTRRLFLNTQVLGDVGCYWLMLDQLWMSWNFWVCLNMYYSNKLWCLVDPWAHHRRRLLPFRKRSLPFLTVHATIGTQAFSHDGRNIFPGLSYNKANNTFLNSLRKKEVEVEAQVEFPFKITERARVTGYWCNS